MPERNVRVPCSDQAPKKLWLGLSAQVTCSVLSSFPSVGFLLILSYQTWFLRFSFHVQFLRAESQVTYFCTGLHFPFPLLM